MGGGSHEWSFGDAGVAELVPRGDEGAGVPREVAWRNNQLAVGEGYSNAYFDTKYDGNPNGLRIIRSGEVVYRVNGHFRAGQLTGLQPGDSITLPNVYLSSPRLYPQPDTV